MGMECREAGEQRLKQSRGAGVGLFCFRARRLKIPFRDGKLLGKGGSIRAGRKRARARTHLEWAPRQTQRWRAADSGHAILLRGIQPDRKVAPGPRQDFDNDRLAHTAFWAAAQRLSGERLMEVAIILSGARQEIGKGREEQFSAERDGLAAMNIGE